jgi:hypothetical protein
LLELLGAVEEADVGGRLREAERLIEQLTRRLTLAGERDRAVLNPRLARVDRDSDEVVIVDAREAELPFVDRLLDEVVRQQPLDVGVAMEDRGGRLHVIAGEEAAAARRSASVSKPGSPLNPGVQRRRPVGDRCGEGDDVGLRVEPELLARTKPGGVLVLECERGRGGSRIDAAGGVARGAIQHGIQPLRERLVVHAQGERPRLFGRQAGRHEVERLAVAVAVLLQPPPDDAAPAVREHCLDRRGLDHDFPFGRLRDQRLRLWLLRDRGGR